MTVKYKQHIFKLDGTFTIAHAPPGAYFDALLVGGGSAGYFQGAYNGSGDKNRVFHYGGIGGQVVYKRVYVVTPRSYSIKVGTAGTNYFGGAFDTNPGDPGSPSEIEGIVVARGGPVTSGHFILPAGTVPTVPIDGDAGTLITDGLFADNTTYYGGDGGNKGGGQYGLGGVGGGGNASPQQGQSGGENTGGGGGAGHYEYGARPGNGGSGVVIIRYPIIV